MAFKKKEHNKCMNRLLDYAKWFGNHKPNLETKYWRYRDATKHIADIIYRQFMAFDTDNPEMDYDIECIEESFKELEKLKNDI